MKTAKLKNGTEFKHIATCKNYTVIEDAKGARKTVKNAEVLEVSEQKTVTRYKRAKIILCKILINKLIKFANR